MVALSELHSRLEHLVTYSSQLIFVSGETIARQQKMLEVFLGQQNDATEIAYLSAKVELTLSDYRHTLYKQLLGNNATDYTRPLNETLAQLNQHDGPVLICIRDAENIPRQLLQELWELVLQSRFARNKQHLNVLLFGQPDWAEQAKAWIPANNKDKPVLLSNESVSSAIDEQSGTVDALLAHRRQQFAQRIQARQGNYEQDINRLNNPWFKAAIASLFVVLFSGILVWQYPEKVQQGWQFLAALTKAVEEKNTLGAKADIPIEEPVSLDAQHSAEEAPATEETPDIRIRTSLTSDAYMPAAREVSSATPPLDKQAPVTDWQSAVANLDKDRQQDARQVDDYQVEDIVNVSQLGKPEYSEIESLEKTEPQQASEPLLETASRYNFDESLILQQEDTRFVVQLAGMSNRDVLNEYIRDNALTDQVWLYQTQRYGGDWFVVLLNNSFASLAQGREASEQIPKALQAGSPFVKRIKQAKNEINSAQKPN